MCSGRIVHPNQPDILPASGSPVSYLWTPKGPVLQQTSTIQGFGDGFGIGRHGVCSMAVSIILMKMPAVCGRRNVIIPSTLPLRNPGSLDTLMMRKGVRQSRPGHPRHFQHKSRTA